MKAYALVGGSIPLMVDIKLTEKLGKKETIERSKGE